MFSRYSVDSGGSLTIQEVNEEDEGDYNCTAISKLGSISSFGSLLVYSEWLNSAVPFQKKPFKSHSKIGFNKQGKAQSIKRSQT